MRAKRGAGGANRYNLGMRRGVGIGDHPLHTLPNDVPVLHRHGAKRAAAGLYPLAGKAMARRMKLSYMDSRLRRGLG